MVKQTDHQRFLVLNTALQMCQTDKEILSEFRRFVLRHYGATVGRIDIYGRHDGPEYDFCMALHEGRFFIAAEGMSSQLLDDFLTLAQLLQQRLLDVHEAIDVLVMQNFRAQLRHTHSTPPSQNMLTFCAQHLGLSSSLATLACYLARGEAPEKIAQAMNISKATMRTYQQRLSKALGVSNQQQLRHYLATGPIACLS